MAKREVRVTVQQVATYRRPEENVINIFTISITVVFKSCHPPYRTETTAELATHQRPQHAHTALYEKTSPNAYDATNLSATMELTPLLTRSVTSRSVIL
jgi:hypothetical protein